MARRRARDWPVIVYSYGVLPSFCKEVPGWMITEAQEMNNLWNRLVEIGRKYLNLYQTDMEQNPQMAPLIRKRDEIETSIQDLSKQIKTLRKKLRTKKHPEIEQLKKKKEELSQELKKLRKEIREQKKEIKAEYAGIFRKMEEEVKEAVSAAPLYWGNKEVVRDRFWVAWKRVKQGHPPRFKRFNGNWIFTYRYTTGGLPAEQAFGEKALFDRRPPSEAYALPRRKRNKLLKVICRFKQGRDRTIAIPIIMHRSLPEGAYIKRVVLVRREHGKDFAKWFLNLTVEVPPEHLLEYAPPDRKPLGVLELGFRKIGEEEVLLKMPTEKGKKKVKRKVDVIRIGVLYDGKKLQDICLPGKIVAKIEAAKDKQAKADRLLQELKDELKEIFIRNPAVPEGIREKASRNEIWGRVRIRGLLKIAEEIEKKEVLSDVAEKIRKTLDEWNRLQNIATRMKKKAFGFRKKFYENLAVELFNRFERVVIPQIDLKQLVRKEKAEELPDKARFQRFLVALYELGTCLERRAEKTGGKLIVWEMPYKTRLCHRCGMVNEPVDPGRLYWMCEGCGHKWDQDENAAINLWRAVKKEASETQPSQT